MPTVFRVKSYRFFFFSREENKEKQRFGMWIYINDKEYFINFADYPSLAKHTVEEFGNYSFDMENNIHWEELDIDIEKEA